jgi:transposase-like protein
MVYTAGFRERMVQRMAGPEGISAAALAREVGLSQPTLSRWLRAARSVVEMEEDQEPAKSGDTRNEESPKRKGGKRTPEEKLRLLGEAADLSEEELGLFLRRNGLHEATLAKWKEAAASGLSEAAKARSGRQSPEAKELAALRRELNRKDKALAEMAALIALKKRVQEIWGDGDDDTDMRSGT